MPEVYASYVSADGHSIHEAGEPLRFVEGRKDYSISWLLLVFLGVFGVHRFYLGKIATGLLYLLTGGLLLIGVLYDLWTLNAQVSEINTRSRAGQ